MKIVCVDILGDAFVFPSGFTDTPDILSAAEGSTTPPARSGTAEACPEITAAFPASRTTTDAAGARVGVGWPTTGLRIAASHVSGARLAAARRPCNDP